MRKIPKSPFKNIVLKGGAKHFETGEFISYEAYCGDKFIGDIGRKPRSKFTFIPPYGCGNAKYIMTLRQALNTLCRLPVNNVIPEVR